MSLSGQVAALASRIAQELKAVRSVMALDSAVVHRSGAETVSGVKTFGSPPLVPIGDQAANPVRRDDGRMTDRRDPNAHQHDGGDITTGLISPARLPAVLTELRTGTIAASLTPDASRSAGGGISNITVTGNITFGAPTNPTDGQVLRYRFLASGAQRTVTFASQITLSTGLTSSTFTIPRGAVLIVALEFVNFRQTSAGAAAPAWVLTAATVSG